MGSSKKFITRLRNKYRTATYRGNRIVLYCEKCRIKDGLSSGTMRYGICSYCGRETRVYSFGYNYNVPTVAKTKIEYWRWRRGKAIWLGHGRKKK